MTFYSLHGEDGKDKLNNWYLIIISLCVNVEVLLPLMLFLKSIGKPITKLHRINCVSIKYFQFYLCYRLSDLVKTDSVLTLNLINFER